MIENEYALSKSHFCILAILPRGTSPAPLVLLSARSLGGSVRADVRVAFVSALLAHRLLRGGAVHELDCVRVVGVSEALWLVDATARGVRGRTRFVRFDA